MLPSRRRHNMAPRCKMIRCSQQLCNLHSSIVVSSCDKQHLYVLNIFFVANWRPQPSVCHQLGPLSSNKFLHTRQYTGEVDGCGATLNTVPIDVLNKDCRRSISAILTWVLENVKISMRPLNSIGN